MAAMCSSCAHSDMVILCPCKVLAGGYTERAQGMVGCRTGGKRPQLVPRRCLVVGEIIYVCNTRICLPILPNWTVVNLNVKCCWVL